MPVDGLYRQLGLSYSRFRQSLKMFIWSVGLKRSVNLFLNCA